MSGALVVACGVAAMTQFIAWSYGDAAALGAPWIRDVNLPYARDLYPLHVGITWLMRIDSRCLVRSLHHAPCNGATVAMLRGAHGILALAALAAVAIGSIVAVLTAAIVQQRQHAASRRPATIAQTHSRLFHLVIGVATGRLLRIGHGAGVASKTALVLHGDDASQNIAIFGGIGSGKTTRGINRLVAQALLQHCGILAFDIKGDYYHTLRELAERTGRPFITIGVHARGLNLLEGLTPEVAASFLKSALLLGSGADSKFWIETGTELARNVLGMLRFVPEAYSLNGLYRWLFDEQDRKQLSAALDKKLVTLARPEHDDERRRLLSSLHYYRSIFMKFEDKVRSNVMAELAQVLSPFAQPDLADAFCTASSSNVQMEHVLRGDVFIVALPLAEYGLAAKTAYTFIKLRFFNLMQQRRRQTEWDQERAVVFVADEYQEVVSCSKTGLSDLNFWDKSRSSGCVGIISAQGMSSFYAAIGDRDLANALVQNFRQVICFRTEDDATIKRITSLLGQIEVDRESYSAQRSRSARGFAATHGTSRSSSVSQSMQSVINPQLFRQLGQNEAIATLSIGGSAYDDVVTMEPVFA
ncbi:MAG: type IV secretion system DNA-binding domain-containing protein [Candidatus Eremiobacteraeota bacterium]|nr:type IV secretion system DNA-binding domain-containing protein [Candidatus Eremiobacteraeota bacterium]MBC5804976.1 type IV secretion system DNA-binding domain-containing protein [Candidatus Eremiobacteraeota bacterium]